MKELFEIPLTEIPHKSRSTATLQGSREREGSLRRHRSWQSEPYCCHYYCFKLMGACGVDSALRRCLLFVPLMLARSMSLCCSGAAKLSQVPSSEQRHAFGPYFQRVLERRSPFRRIERWTFQVIPAVRRGPIVAAKQTEDRPRPREWSVVFAAADLQFRFTLLPWPFKNLRFGGTLGQWKLDTIKIKLPAFQPLRSCRRDTEVELRSFGSCR